MSVRTVDRETKVKQVVTVYTCDGPECSKAVERPVREHGVPPGWIFVENITASDPAVAGKPQHYCSRDCLADAVVP